MLVKARDRRAKVPAGHYRGVHVALEALPMVEAPPGMMVTIAATSWADHPYRFTSRVKVWGKNGPQHLLAEIDSVIDAAPDLAADRRAQQKKAEARATEIRPYLDQEWPHKKALADALAERARIEAEIDAQVKQEPAPAASSPEPQAA